MYNLPACEFLWKGKCPFLPLLKILSLFYSHSPLPQCQRPGINNLYAQPVVKTVCFVVQHFVPDNFPHYYECGRRGHTYTAFLISIYTVYWYYDTE